MDMVDDTWSAAVCSVFGCAQPCEGALWWPRLRSESASKHDGASRGQSDVLGWAGGLVTRGTSEIFHPSFLSSPLFFFTLLPSFPAHLLTRSFTYSLSRLPSSLSSFTSYSLLRLFHSTPTPLCTASFL